MVDLLRIVLNTTYFKYDGDFYSQCDGAAMGSPVSPIVANIFMEWFEDRALHTFHSPPRYWGRYVDDAVAIMNKDDVEEFTKHINSIHQKIKFTSERESDGKLPMLDTLIKRHQDGSLSFSVYRKATHTDQYLAYDSHQPMEHKMGVIRTLTHRAKQIVSNEEDKTQEYEHIKKVLSISGYPRWLWSAPNNRRRVPHPASTERARIKGHVTLPYVHGVSEAIARKMRKKGVAVHLKLHKTLRSILVSPKDKDDTLEKCGVVYQIECNECEEAYIGETERQMGKRLTEHKRKTSAVQEHMEDKGHHPEKVKVTVVDKDDRWFERGVKEAVYIRARSPSLNRDQGRHTLPPIYNSLIKSCDRVSSSQNSQKVSSSSHDQVQS